MKLKEIEALKEGMLIGSGRSTTINAVFMITKISRHIITNATTFEVVRISPANNVDLYKKDPLPSILERRENTFLTTMELLTPRHRKLSDE